MKQQALPLAINSRGWK